MVLHTNFQTYSTKIEVPTDQNVVWPTIMAQTLLTIEYLISVFGKSKFVHLYICLYTHFSIYIYMYKYIHIPHMYIHTHIHIH